MIIAIVLGLAVGAVSFLPLVAGTRLVRKHHPKGSFGQAGFLLLGVAISFVVLAGAALVCILAFRDVALPFVLAEVGALLVVTVAFGISRVVRK